MITPDPSRGYGFHERWMRAMQNERAVTLPSGRASLLIQTGVAKRVSDCHLCHTPVLAGEKRVEFFIRFGVWRQYKAGGSSGRICYVHAGCLAAVIGESNSAPVGRNPNQCIHCRRLTSHRWYEDDLDGDIPTRMKESDSGRRALAFVASGSMMTYICESCSKQPMYRCCSYCGLWSYKRRMTAKADKSGYLCYHCDDELEIIDRSDDWVTARSMKREMTLRKRAQRGYEQAEAWINELRAVR